MDETRRLRVSGNEVSGTPKGYNYGGLWSSPQPFTPPSDPHLNAFTKIALKLGFGIRKDEEEGSALTLGLIDVVPDEEQAPPTGLGTAPLTPSAYIRRLSVLGPRPLPIREVTSRDSVALQWRMNYQEAGIFLEEGENNEEFRSHPDRTESLPAYILAHAHWLHFLDLVGAIALLTLVAIENPKIPTQIQMDSNMVCWLELFLLFVLGCVVIVKVRWLGLRESVRHPRTILKILLLMIMGGEALGLLFGGTTHYSRALRPLFLLDNKHLRGLRRFAREVLQCVPPIIDMLVLLFFLIFLFALIGHFLFGRDPIDPFFMTLEDSFVNLFVLLTTANFPDVMMEAYHRNMANALFFAIYLSLLLYFFMNLVLGVVYENFCSVEKQKLRKLVAHKREASEKAYNLLLSRANEHGVIFRHFCGMLLLKDPIRSLRDNYLLFKALDHSGDGYLNKEEFVRFFEYNTLKWTPILSQPEPAKIKRRLKHLLSSPYSEIGFNGIVVGNGICLLMGWYFGWEVCGWDSLVFASLFMGEVFFKLWLWGSHRFLHSGWLIFDLFASVLFFSVSLLCFWFPGRDSGHLLRVIRPLRLFRLFKLKKRYRTVLGTLFLLLRPMASVGVLILLLYYSFAIVGMGLFGDLDLRNIANGTLFESYYATPANEEEFALRFYENNFSNILRSYVTLFELMVVNNWYVIMEGHVRATSHLARIYFFLFYLSTIILLNIVVAFILDAFLLRMRYKTETQKGGEHRLFRREVFLTTDEVHFTHHTLLQNHKDMTKFLKTNGNDLETQGGLLYVGKGTRTKEILFKRLQQQ